VVRTPGFGVERRCRPLLARPAGGQWVARGGAAELLGALAVAAGPFAPLRPRPNARLGCSLLIVRCVSVPATQLPTTVAGPLAALRVAAWPCSAVSPEGRRGLRGYRRRRTGTALRSGLGGRLAR